MELGYEVKLVFVLSCICAVSYPDTYTININGTLIHCVKCPAGTYLLSDCSSDHGNASCQTCEIGTYQPGTTTATSCANCRTECPHNTPQHTVQFVKENCTATRDTECLCVEGYYGDGGGCRKWRECQPGEGVVDKGNHIPVSCQLVRVCFTGSALSLLIAHCFMM